MNKMTRNLLGAVALGTLVFSGAAPGFAADVVIKVAPPALRAEVVPKSPGVDFAWRPGNWRWNGTAHEWAGGEYMRRPHPGAEWAAGNWEHRGEGWGWNEGHWR
jgi:WXXGXW repeat (2 copies)